MNKFLVVVGLVFGLAACNGALPDPAKLPQAPTYDKFDPNSGMTNEEVCAEVAKYDKLYSGYKTWGKAWLDLFNIDVNDFLKNVKAVDTFKKYHGNILANCKLEESN